MALPLPLPWHHSHLAHQSHRCNTSPCHQRTSAVRWSSMNLARLLDLSCYMMGCSQQRDLLEDPNPKQQTVHFQLGNDCWSWTQVQASKWLRHDLVPSAAESFTALVVMLCIHSVKRGINNQQKLWNYMKLYQLPLNIIEHLEPRNHQQKYITINCHYPSRKLWKSKGMAGINLNQHNYHYDCHGS